LSEANVSIDWVDIDTVKPHPDNPRVGMLPAVVESIRKNGWHGALVVQKSTGHILAGNHRWLAAKSLGMRKVPVHVRDVDDATARRILLADNRTSDLAYYDEPKLQEQLALILAAEPDHKDTALEGTGYTPEDVQQMEMALAAGEPKEWGSLGTNEEARDRYDKSTIRQIGVILSAEEYDRVIPILKDILEEQGLDTISDAVLWLVEMHAKRHPPKATAGATADTAPPEGQHFTQSSTAATTPNEEGAGS
jgi:hypothetical protein